MGALWQALAATTLAVTAVPAPHSTVVPALIGQSIESARNELAGEGLGLTVVSGPAAADSIVDRQKPDPGTKVRAGRAVTVSTTAKAAPPPPPEHQGLGVWLVATGAGLGTFVVLLLGVLVLRRPKVTRVEPTRKPAEPSPKPAEPRYTVRVQPRVSAAVVHVRDPWTLS